jgi:dTDP-4-dehydrorhamnose reductase
MKILIIGKGYVGERCASVWSDAVLAEQKVYSVRDILDLLEKHTPDVVLNAAGVTGKPNVDWCETHQIETINGNTTLPIMIADACQQKNIYLLHIGSGCIFYGESPDPEGWKETDFGNPVAVYSRAKYAADLALSTLSNVGIARIRMPLDSVPSSRNIINKLVSYNKVIDVANSLTVIDDMVEVFHQLLSKKATGIFHITNPGVIKHRQILDLYKKYVDPNLPDKEWISEDDLVSTGLAAKKRSTNKLQSHNLEKVGITMKPVLESAELAIKKYSEYRIKSD